MNVINSISVISLAAALDREGSGIGQETADDHRGGQFIR
jgi:hypothetical protein